FEAKNGIVVCALCECIISGSNFSISRNIENGANSTEYENFRDLNLRTLTPLMISLTDNFLLLTRVKTMISCFLASLSAISLTCVSIPPISGEYLRQTIAIFMLICLRYQRQDYFHCS